MTGTEAKISGGGVGLGRSTERSGSIDGLFSRVQDVVIVFDEQGRYIFQNPAHRLLIGLGDDELRRHLLKEQIGEPMFETIREALAQTGQWRGEVRSHTKSGVMLLLEFSCGKLEGMGENWSIAFMKDIQNRKRTEEGLRRSAKELGEFFENAAVGCYWAGSDGTILRANRKELEMLGYTYEEYVGHNIAEFHVDKDAVDDFLLRLARNETVRDQKARLICKDGSIKDVLLDSNVFWENGEFIHMRCFTRDVTEAQRAERRRAAQYRVARILADALNLDAVASEIINTVSDALRCNVGVIWLLDGKENVLKCANIWFREGVDGQEFERVSREMRFASGEDFPGQVWKDGRSFGIPNLWQSKSFRRKDAALNMGLRSVFATPILDGQQPIGVIEFFTDQTRIPDDDLLHWLTSLGSQIGQFIVRCDAEEELQKQIQEAENANRAKDQFLAVLSHELRTPLSPVLAMVNVLSDDPGMTKDACSALEMIGRNVELEARLIDDLLDLTRISEGKLELELETIDAHECLSHAYQICRTEIGKKEIKVSLRMDANRFHVKADSIRLQQVFWNLIKNAVKFTPEGGSLDIISTNDSLGRLQVKFTDTGIGIDPQLLPRIFDAFEQGESATRRRFGGLGLGLAISKTLIEGMGGSLSASSEGTDKGACFTVVIGTIDATPVEPAYPIDQIPQNTQPSEIRILLVDDHEDTLKALQRTLERRGYKVQTANCVTDALKTAENYEFDLLISDIGLPDGSGTDLMLRLGSERGIKGIAISGFGMDEDIHKSKSAGFYEHLTKPVNIHRLDAVIQQVSSKE